MKFRIPDYDLIYLSYDEPNAEKNYADLCNKIPWAKRVHGVHGSDAAHKACAELAETDRLIIVDGDNVVDQNFLNQEFDIPPNVDMSKSVISFTAKNEINGLVYGNGGIKSWPKSVIQNMRTHENASPDNFNAQVDFCWDINYYHLPGTFSTIMNNATPQQAWRAGFREGVKMALNEGKKVSKQHLKALHEKNLNRLYIWCMVGADVTNGDWAILGARAGLFKTMCTDWDYVNVRDFEYLNNLWNEEFVDFEGHEIYDESCRYTTLLVSELGIPIDDPLMPGQSKFFKTVYINPSRGANTISNEQSLLPQSQYDIVMITYNEPNGEKNWQDLKRRFPRAKRVDGVKGIHQAHIKAAEICNTDMIWIVDGDAEIKSTFSFDYYVESKDLDCVYVWRSENPINGLQYGYGGVKLFPRELTLNMDVTKPDMTTSISRKFKPVKDVANVTAFNTDEFSSWKSAFRECCKLASKIIDRQKDDETDIRLQVWCSDIALDKPFGKYAIKGAKMGKEYGQSNKGDLEALSKINDFAWLKEKFDASF